MTSRNLVRISGTGYREGIASRALDSDRQLAAWRGLSPKFAQVGLVLERSVIANLARTTSTTWPLTALALVASPMQPTTAATPSS
jgi:hypothetical protein